MADQLSAPNRSARLRRNIDLLYWKNFFQNGLFLNPAWSVFLLSRDVRPDQLFYLTIVFSLASVAALIPTIWIGNRYGRTRVMLLAAAALTAAFVMQVWVSGFLLCALVNALRGLQLGLQAGTEESIIVDTSRELSEGGAGAAITKNSGRSSSGAHAMKCLVPFVFGGAALYLTTADLYLWMLVLSIAAIVASFLPLIRLVEPVASSDPNVDADGRRPAICWRKTSRSVLSLLRQRPILIYFSLHRGAMFGSGLILFLAYPLWITQAGLGSFWLGAMYAAFHAALYLLARAAWKLDLAFGAPKVVNVMSASCALLGFVTIFLPGPIAAFGLCLTAMSLSSARETYYVSHVNEFIPQELRVPTLSALQALQRMIEMPLMLLTAWAARHGLPWVFIAYAAINLALLIIPYPSLAHMKRAKAAAGIT